jgi:SHS2 domain-containing protein
MIRGMDGCEVEELGHTSEIGLRARAPSLADLFSCLVRAMIALSGVAPAHNAERAYFEIEVAAVDLESLLVDWLNEVLYLHEVYGIVPDAVEVEEITPQLIQATIRGTHSQQAPDLQIKAVTYHQLWVGQENQQWKAEVFFDI